MKIYGMTDNRSIYHEGSRTTVGALWRLSRALRILAEHMTRAIGLRSLVGWLNGREQ